MLEDVAPFIQNAFFEIDGKSDVAIRIKKELLRLKGFENMTVPDTYKDYVVSPYKVDTTESFLVPLIDPTGDHIEFYGPNDQRVPQTSFNISTDSRFIKIKEFFPDIDSSAITLDGNFIKVTTVPLQIQRPGKDVSMITISMNLENENSIKDIHFLYNNIPISVLMDSMTAPVYTNFITQLPYYLDTLDQAVVTLGTLSEPVNILPLQKKVTI